MRRRGAIWLMAAVGLHLVVAGWFASVRPIDGDEGYYGLAARLVADGQRPYADFFYPQGPLLPVLYAPAAAVAGAPQLPSLRLVSVLWSAVAIALLAVWLARAHPSRPGLGAAALLLVALSGDWLTWSVTVKTYAMSGAGVALALLATSGAATGRPRTAMTWALVGGAALGLVASARLLYAPAAVAPAVILLCRGRRWPAATWLVGLALGLAPVWAAWAADPGRFLFNNLHYHQLRFSELEDAAWWRRAAAAVGTLVTAVGTSPGLLALIALSGWGLRTRRRTGPVDAAEDAGLAVAAVYTATCLLPDPAYRQYFTGGLPIMLLPAAMGGAMRLPWPGSRVTAALTVAAPLLLLAALGWLRHDLPREPHWQLDHYRRVCARIERGTRPDDVVFAFWPGYVAGAGRQPLPGLENQFAIGVSERLDAVDRRRFHVAGRQELARAFRREAAAVAVLGAWMYDINTALDDREMTLLLEQFERHYAFVEEVDGVKLCEPLGRASGPPAPRTRGGW
ncbi:hypothetical protein GF314_10615 [bacterium]|nr:hypothetical protein [bacterium]